MTFIRNLPGPLLIFLGALSLSFGGLIVKSFEGATLWQILFWRSLFFSLTILAFLTDTVLYLPIIALPLIVTAGSILLQIFSFQVFGKRIFKVAPLHHHFEKIGWPHYKITMRYWVFAVSFSFLGTALALIS